MARNGSENMTSMLILCFFKSVVDSNLLSLEEFSSQVFRSSSPERPSRCSYSARING